MQDAASGQGSLMMAFVALIDRTCFELAVRSVTAFRANIPFWPALFVQCLTALFFGGVFFQEIRAIRSPFEIESDFSV